MAALEGQVEGMTGLEGPVPLRMEERVVGVAEYRPAPEEQDKGCHPRLEALGAALEERAPLLPVELGFPVGGDVRLT